MDASAEDRVHGLLYFNRRHQVVGHLFQGKFKSTVVEPEKYLLEVSRYLHLNPVRGMMLGRGTPMERRGMSARVPLEQLPGLHRLAQKEISFLESEPIQGVFQTCTDRP